MEKKPSKQAATGAPVVETELKESPKDVPQDVLCPIMSYRASMSTSTMPLTALKRPDLSLDIPNPLTLVPVAVPCMQRKCALAVGNDEFGFIGCGLMAMTGIEDAPVIGIALDRLRDALSRVLGAGPGLAGGMIAMQGATLELKRMLSAVGLAHSETMKQTVAVTKLINHLIDRMERPPTPPAPPRSPAGSPPGKPHEPGRKVQ